MWNQFLETVNVSRRPEKNRRNATTLNEDRCLTLTDWSQQNMNATLVQQHIRSATDTQFRSTLSETCSKL